MTLGPLRGRSHPGVLRQRGGRLGEGPGGERVGLEILRDGSVGPLGSEQRRDGGQPFGRGKLAVLGQIGQHP